MSETLIANVPVAVARSTTTQGVTSCPICHAFYGPAQGQEYLLKAPALAVEAAFMSMCHFCFRCRRPSCPQCWDAVHGLCGACVHEVGLIFRIESAPLPGTLPLPSRQAQTQQSQRKLATPLSLVYIQAGQLEQPPIATPTAVIAQRPASRSTEPVQLVAPERVRMSPFALRVRRIELGLTWFLFVLLLVLVLLILAATFFVSANVWLIKILHVDIRAELTYLWQLFLSILQLIRHG